MKKRLELSDTEEPVLKVNQEYAKRYEHNKRREELHQLEEKYKGKGGSSDSEYDSTSVTEDDDADLLTPEVDVQIMKTLASIRKKDSSIYDKNKKFFEETTEEQTELPDMVDNPKGKMSMREYQLDQMKKEVKGEQDTEDNEPLPYTLQQEALKKSILSSINATLDHSDDALFQKKQVSDEKEAYKQYLLDQIPEDALEGNDADDAFLVQYMLNQGWKGKKTAAHETEDSSQSDLEDAEAFEAAYNFRYEQSTDLVSHARDLPGVRKADDARKQKRKEKAEKKASEKRREQEELKRLKNLKKLELTQKIGQISKVSGKNTLELSLEDLEDDFDPATFDQKMSQLFDEDFYNQSDDCISQGKLTEEEFDLEDALLAEAKESLKSNVVAKKALKKLKESIKTSQKEYFNLHYEDSVGGLKTRFHYAQVEPSLFGISVPDIISAPEKTLNKHVGLKKLAAYKPTDEQKKDIKKYSDKKRLRSFYHELKKRTKEMAESIE